MAENISNLRFDCLHKSSSVHKQSNKQSGDRINGFERSRRRFSHFNVTRNGVNKRPRQQTIRYVPESSRNPENKPVVRLFDPTSVPKTGRYFEHDSRDKFKNNYNNSFKSFRFNNHRQRMHDLRANNQRNDIPIGWRNEAAGNRRNESYDQYSLESRRFADSDGKWLNDKFDENNQ